MSKKSSDTDMTGKPENEAAETLSADTKGLISKQLRQVYGKMLDEPLPDKFSALLDHLARTESKK